MPLKAITANRLRDGAVVWFGPGDAWVERVADASVFEAADDLDAAGERAQRFVGQRVVVDVYPIEVALTANGPEPLRLRERLRALGPSVRLDLGKQAEETVTQGTAA